MEPDKEAGTSPYRILFLGIAHKADQQDGVQLVAGIDLLPTPSGGYVVLEVNAVPGWRTLGPVTGIDVAIEIVRQLEGSQ